MARTLVWAVVILLVASVSIAIKHDLKAVDDLRSNFIVEKFGLAARGQLNINITGLTLRSSTGEVVSPTNPVGLLIHVTVQDSASVSYQTASANSDCPLSNEEKKDTRIAKFDGKDFYRQFEVTTETEGIYNVYLINCNPKTKISFDLYIEQFNIDASGNKNYLNVGQFPLPGLYGGFAVLLIVAGVYWIARYMRGQDRNVNKVHWLMTCVIFIRAFSLVCEAVEYHWIQVTGETGAWNVLYYIFAFLRGIGMFAVIAAIGSGWAFLTPFLGDREKKIFLIVIPLQILNNIALIVTEENMEGASSWLAWRDVFRLVDVICCFAVLVPIFWSIHHLKQAAQSDGKARRSMEKLQIFRRFYLTLVAYFYFTRIMVALMMSSLPFRYLWVTDFSTEFATFAFFISTGYTFRPLKDNVYFKVDDDEQNVKGAVTLEEIEAAAAL